MSELLSRSIVFGRILTILLNLGILSQYDSVKAAIPPSPPLKALVITHIFLKLARHKIGFQNPDDCVTILNKY